MTNPATGDREPTPVFILMPDGDPVTLDECPEGLFLFNGTLAMMSEYATMSGHVRQRDAYIVSSGEYFWGGTSQAADRAKLVVQPLIPNSGTQSGSPLLSDPERVLATSPGVREAEESTPTKLAAPTPRTSIDTIGGELAKRLPIPDAVSMTGGLICLGYENADERDLAYNALEAFGAGALSALQAPHAGGDTFNGDNAKLIGSIEALLALDAKGALAPHGIGGHARTLLSAAASRLASPPEGRQDGGVLPEGTLCLHGNDITIAYATREEALLAFDFLEAALTHSTPVEAPPAGCVLVPVHPTEEMSRAGVRAIQDWDDGDPDGIIMDFRYLACWKAMLAALAAQPLPKQGTGEAHHIDDAELLEETERQVREMLAADPETMSPDTYTGGNFNGVTEGEK